MRKLGIMIGGFMLLLTVVAVNAPAQDTQKSQESKQTEQESKENYMTTLEAFWNEMEQDVKKLSEKAQEAGSEIEEEYHRRVPEFKQTLKTAREKLAEMGDAEIWQEFQAGTEQASENVKQTYYKLKSTMINSKEDYQTYVELRIEDLKQRIAKLTDDVKQAGKVAQGDMQDALDSLQQQQNALQADLKKLQDATKEDWEDLKDQIEPALEEAEIAYEKVKSQLN